MSEQNDDSEDISESKHEMKHEIKQKDFQPKECRMYEKEYPEIGDILVARVNKMIDMGAYCSLLEYNNLEGMLLHSELQRKRIRSIKSVIRPGRTEYVQVLRVNREKGYIDLSRKRVTQEDLPAVKERYNKAKASHSIIKQVARLSRGKYTMLQLYELFGWPMARKFKFTIDGFKWAMENWEECLKEFPEIPLDCRDNLKKNIENRLKPQEVTVRATIDVTCFSSEGVDAIKAALKAGLQESTDDCKISIKLVAPPRFTVSLNTFKQDEGIKVINKSIDTITNNIKVYNGSCSVVTEAQITAVESK